MANKCPKCQFENPDTVHFCGECGTQIISSEEIPASPTKTLETPTEELTTGSTFAGRYQIIEELGKGGMGKVYKALDTDLKEKVAIKLIKPEVAVDKKTIERFRNELKFARKIRHKNVCQMYDLNKEEGTHYITMEYVHGEDLKRLIRKMGQMSAGQVISTAMQVCDGMTEAHRLGVVHRDLKPQNIMVDEEGNARIMDFGIARSVKGKGITGAGVMIGTPEYMSPEQVEGKESDQRSDIYSLGVILYEMVTGRVPFEGETPFTIGVKHKSESPRNPKELNSQIPDDLSRVILRCMEKDKEQRYQSTGEVRSELENIEKGIPTTEKVISKRKPITSKEITVTFGLKKLLIPALVVVALVIIVVVIWQPWSQKEAIPIPSDKPYLAVMYFENNTGDEKLDHWRKMLSDLLITDLSQSKYLSVLSGDRLFKILSGLNQLETETFSADILKEVAIKGGVNHLLLGKYARMGETFRIDVVLQEAKTGEIIGSERVDARGEEEVFPKVDELTRRIKVNFKLSAEQIAGDMDKEIGKITTSSPEALRYYTEGRKYFSKGDLRQSIQLMNKAIALDSEFAMAYRSNGASYYNLGNFTESRKFYQKAGELIDRVSDRERYILQVGKEKTLNKKIDVLNKLLELYPEDSIGNNRLGNTYGFLEEWDMAIERHEIARKYNPEGIIPCVNLSGNYVAKGLHDKSREVLEYYLDNYSDNMIVHEYLAYTYLSLGECDIALSELNKALSFDPGNYQIVRFKGDSYLYKGDLVEAEKTYQELLEAESRDAQFFGRNRLGHLNLLEGRFQNAKDQWQKGVDLNKVYYFHFFLAYLYLRTGKLKSSIDEWEQGWSHIGVDIYNKWRMNYLYLKGLTHIEMKSLNITQETADELKEMIENGRNRKAMRYYYSLLAEIELKKENFSKAIEYSEKASSLLSYQEVATEAFDHHALFLAPLASAYYILGDLDKAREEYEKITKLTTGRLYYGDIYAKAFYMLGKIYEQQGDTAKAIEHYEKFLTLWKNADPGIAESEDAKKRLAGLKRQRP